MEKIINFCFNVRFVLLKNCLPFVKIFVALFYDILHVYFVILLLVAEDLDLWFRELH